MAVGWPSQRGHVKACSFSVHSCQHNSERMYRYKRAWRSGSMQLPGKLLKVWPLLAPLQGGGGSKKMMETKLIVYFMN